MHREAKWTAKSDGSARPRSSRAGVASLKALKVATYSLLQHTSRRAQPRQTTSAARSKMTAGFSSFLGGGVPKLSQRERRASALSLSRWRMLSDSRAAFRRGMAVSRSSRAQ